MDQGSSIALSCGVGHRCGSDPALLWPWYRPAAIAPIRPLPWEPSYAAGVDLKRQKKTKNNNNEVGVPVVAQQVKNLT